MNNASTATLLHIDASPRQARSHSRQLGHEFVAAWQLAHPAGRIVIHDLGTTPPPFVTESWVEGAFTPAEGHSPAAQAAMTVSNAYVDELLTATDVLITTPMYNLNIPAALKAWIDQIVRFGRTFNAGPAGFVGLAAGKRVRVIVASGSDFRPGTPAAGYDFLSPYLRAIFGFIGINDVEFIYAHSQNQGNPAGAQAINDAIATSRKLAAA